MMGIVNQLVCQCAMALGFYPGTQQPGALFITMSKQGSTINGLMDAIGTLCSLGLQYGVPLETFVRKFAHTRFEPRGFTGNPDIPIAKSITDSIFSWLGMEFIPGYREENAPRRPTLPDDVSEDMDWVTVAEAQRLADSDPVSSVPVAELERSQPQAAKLSTAHFANGSSLAITRHIQTSERIRSTNVAWTGPPCPRCQAFMAPTGRCHRCLSCGNTEGGCG